jgi:hypothetical protein
MSEILVNNKEYTFSGKNLPCLIHSEQKMGGSHFSISLISDLFLNGSKILFFTAYKQAKDSFLSQIKGFESRTAKVSSTEELEAAQNAQAIIINNGDVDLLIAAINLLKNHIIFIKNIELFDEAIFDSISSSESLILSGNIDSCKLQKQIRSKSFNTKIDFPAPGLEKYTARIVTYDKKGSVTVINKN